jgi:small-conductance mechanosensitive channel
MASDRFWPKLLLSAVLVLCLSGPAGAAVLSAESPTQVAPLEIPETLTPQQVDQILAGLTDAQVRQLLAGELRAKVEDAAARQQGGGGGLGVRLVQLRLGLERLADTLLQRAGQVSRGMALLPDELMTSIDKVSGGRGLGGFLGQIVMFLGLMLLGVAAHWGLRRVMAPARERIEAPAEVGLFDRFCGVAFRAIFDLLAVGGFAAVTLGLAVLIFADKSPDRSFMITYLTGTLIVYGAALAGRFLLAPYAPSLRLAPLGDGAARFLYRWFVLLAAVAVYAWLTAGLLILTGMKLEAHLMVVLLTGAVMAVLITVMILQARAGVAATIRGPAEAQAGDTGSRKGRSLRALFADTWHLFAILYVLLIWLLWAMSMLARGPSTIWAATASVGALLLFPILDRGACRILEELMGRGADSAPETRGGALTVMQRGARVVIAVVLGGLVLQLWDVNLSGGMGAQAQSALLDASFDIAVAALFAYLGWQLIKVGIDRRLVPREVGGVLVEPNDRMRTLLPLARRFLVVVLVIVTVMLVLSALGVNIGPLLAGAGVVGIAIGFGAQTLVRDVVSGIFFLLEDAFRVGEYVEMGELRGEVEAIGLRSLRLRHHRGPIHTIPFGELRAITNHNRDWVIYKMNFRVPFDTDIDQVKKIIKGVGAEMMADPDLGPRLLEPLKSQGVLEIDDSALIIRVKFMCLPREQFILRREAYKRVKAAFEANGIEFARRKVEVHAPAGGTGAGAEPLPGAAAAAAAAAGQSGPQTAES